MAHGTSPQASSAPVAGGQWILETEGLSKEFKGFSAVQDVALRVREGHIHALIGPNGAGKTTVFNLLTKFLAPTRGRIRFAGEDITALSPAQIARRGVVRSFQISATFAHMTALENVRVALQRRLGQSMHFWRPESLQSVDLGGHAHVLAVELPYGRKRALEIATTLAMDPRLMLLDEPTQGMGHEDVDRVVALIQRVARGRTVLMVEHNLSVVERLCDRITVLQRGQILAEGPYAEVSQDPRVLEAYVGVEA
jgi:branched-chain amino acid transport system ATP-binding protein